MAMEGEAEALDSKPVQQKRRTKSTGPSNLRMQLSCEGKTQEVKTMSKKKESPSSDYSPDRSDEEECSNSERIPSVEPEKKRTYKYTIPLITRCSMNIYVRDRDRMRFRECHKSIMRRTPFSPYIDIAERRTFNINFLEEILVAWRGTNLFRLGKVDVPFTCEDVALILGVPSVGRVVPLHGRVQQSHLHKCYPKESKFDRKRICEFILELVSSDDPVDVENTVRFWILLLFSTFLAPRTNYTCKPQLLHCLDNLNNLGEFAWATAFHGLILHKLGDAVDAAKKKRKGKKILPKKENIEVHGGATRFIYGCSTSLCVWLLEHTRLQSPITLSVYPRILRWESSKKKKGQINISSLKPHESLVECSSIPLKDMKPASSNVNEHAGSDKHQLSNRVFPERSLSMHARFDAQTVGLFSSSTRVDFGRSSSLSRAHDVGSWRRRSLSLSRDGSSRTFEDIPSDVLAQIGDSGDRVVDDQEENGISSEGSGRGSWRKGSIRLSHELEYGIPEGAENSFIEQVSESGNRVVSKDAYGASHSLRVEQGSVTMTENSVFPVEDGLLYSGFPPGDMKLNEFSSTMLPLTGEMASPLPTSANLYSREKEQYKLPRSLDYMAHLIHLAVFGIFGVFARHLLQKLFGPGCLALTSDETPLYLDLPANMAGSFLMGWFGIIFKGDVRHVSEHLAVGLTTGFMGSLTTFSGWNQKMLDLSSKDHWVFAVAGIILGFFIVNESFRYGVASAEWLRKCLSDKFSRSPESATFIPERWRLQRPRQHFTVMIMMLLLLGLLWSISGVLARTRLDSVTDGAVLWLACIVGPPGVWLRWYLARFNGRGLGKKGSLKWLPLGTLAANLLAALIMAALATISKAVNTKRCGIITRGVQFGFLGCLSTVSTFAAEIYGMRQSGHEGRAFTYAAATFILSFAGGTLVYSVPVWTGHYH